MKKYVSLITLALMMAGLFAGCATESSVPCIYCNESPSRAYKTSYGTKSYVCDECSSECFFCGEPSPKKYTSVDGEISFACKECLDSLKG